MFSLLPVLSLAATVFAARTESELLSRQVAPPVFRNVSISTAWNDAFVIQPQAPIQAGSALLLQPKSTAFSLDQTFNITDRATSLQLTGTNLCIDGGAGRSNGSPITMVACNSALASQKWTFNTQGFLQIDQTNYCADLYLGAVRSGTKIVLWQCINGDKNHMWKAQNVTAPISPTSTPWSAQAF